MQRYRNLFLLSGVLAAGLVVRMLAAQQLDGLVVDPLGKATVPVAVASPATDVVLVSTQEPASEPQPASATTVATLPAIMENAAETAPASDPFSNGPTPAAGTLPATAPRDWLTTQPNPAAGADGALPPGASSPSRVSLPPGVDPASGSNPFGQYPPKPAAAYPSKSFPGVSNDRAVESIPRSRSSNVATPPQTLNPDAVKATSPRRTGVNSKANNDPFDARAQGAAASNLPTFNRSEDLFRTTTAPDTTAPDTRQLANNWLEAERALLTVRLQADQENDDAALRELRTAVEAAFDARQKWQQAEVERLISDLKVLQSEIALRASQRERLIQKRMEQLAESKPGADPTAIKLPGRTSALPPSYPGVPALGEADRYAPESLLIDAAKVKSRNERKVMRVAIETRIKMTKVTLEQKKDELDRLWKLHDQGTVPQNEVAAVKADVQRNELLLDAYYQVLELLNDSEKEENAPKDERQQQAQERAAVDKQDAALNSAELPTPAATTSANPVATTSPGAKKPVVAADPNAIPANCFDRELFLITRYGGYERFQEELNKKIIERQEAAFERARILEEQVKADTATLGEDHPNIALKAKQRDAAWETGLIYMRLKNRLAEFKYGFAGGEWPGININSPEMHSQVFFANGFYTSVPQMRTGALQTARASLPFSLLLELWTARTVDDLAAVKTRFEGLQQASLLKLEAARAREGTGSQQPVVATHQLGGEITFVSEELRVEEAKALAYDLFNDYFMNATLQSIEEPTPSMWELLGRCDKARTVIEQLYPLPANQNAEPEAPAAAVDATTSNPLGTTTPTPAAAGSAPSDPAAAPAASSGTGSLTPGTPNAAPNAVTPPAATVPVTDAPAEGTPAAVEATPSAPAANNPAVPTATAPAAANPSSVAEIASTTDASTSASSPAAAISPATSTANPATADGVATTGSAAPASSIPASTSGPIAPPENCFDLGIYQIVREGTIDKFAGELMDVIAARRDATLAKARPLEQKLGVQRGTFIYGADAVEAAIKKLEPELKRLAIYTRISKRFGEYIADLKAIGCFERYSSNGHLDDPIREIRLVSVAFPAWLMLDLWSAQSEDDLAKVRVRFLEAREANIAVSKQFEAARELAQEQLNEDKITRDDYFRLDRELKLSQARILAFEMFAEYFESSSMDSIERPMPAIQLLFARSEKVKALIARLPEMDLWERSKLREKYTQVSRKVIANPNTVVRIEEEILSENSFDPELMELIRSRSIGELARDLAVAVAIRKVAAVKETDKLQVAMAEHSTDGNRSPARLERSRELDELFRQQNDVARVYERISRRLAEYVANIKAIGGFEEQRVSSYIEYRKDQLRASAMALPASLLIELWSARGDADLRKVKVRFEDLKRDSLQRLNASRISSAVITAAYASGNVHGGELSKSALLNRALEARALSFEIFEAYFRSSTMTSIEQPMPAVQDLFTSSESSRQMFELLPVEDSFVRQMDLQFEEPVVDETMLKRGNEVVAALKAAVVNPVLTNSSTGTAENPIASGAGELRDSSKPTPARALRSSLEAERNREVINSVYVGGEFEDSLPVDPFDHDLFELVRGRRFGDVVVALEERLATRRTAALQEQVALAGRIEERRKVHGADHPLIVDAQSKLDQAAARIAIYDRLSLHVKQYREGLDAIGWYGPQRIETEYSLRGDKPDDYKRQLRQAAVSLPASLLLELWTARSEQDLANVRARFKSLSRELGVKYLAVQVAYLEIDPNVMSSPPRLSEDDHKRLIKNYIDVGSWMIAFEVFDEYFQSVTLASIDEPMPSLKLLLSRSLKARFLIGRLGKQSEFSLDDAKAATVAR